MSRLRWALVALLTVSTVLFAVGVAVERSDADSHVEASAQPSESGEATEPEGAHDEAAEQSGTAEGGEGERVLGVDLESTPPIVLAVIAGLGLAAVAASRFGTLPGVLLAIAAIALAWAALDIREVIHQLDESRTGVAILALLVAALHLAAAVVGGRLARDRVRTAS